MKTKNTKKKKNNKKKNSFKDIINSTKFLTVVFVLLLILVIVLSILCYKKNQEEKKYKPSDIMIPILKTGDESGFSINAPTLAYSKEYVFRVTNHNKKKINKKEISYKITISNTNDCVITVTKNNSKKDLMKDQKETILSGKLAKDKEDDIYYHVKIVSYGDLAGKDLINIKINS